MEKITQFKGQYSFLSNMSPATFVWQGIFWPTSEHAYVGAKTLDNKVRLHVAKDIKSPADAKRYGRMIDLRPDWDEVKVDLMYEVVYEKFRQNPPLKEKLLATGDAILEEGNMWRDTFWGICPPNSGNGRNELGKILMAVRAELRR